MLRTRPNVSVHTHPSSPQNTVPPHFDLGFSCSFPPCGSPAEEKRWGRRALGKPSQPWQGPARAAKQHVTDARCRRDQVFATDLRLLRSLCSCQWEWSKSSAREVLLHRLANRAMWLVGIIRQGKTRPELILRPLSHTTTQRSLCPARSRCARDCHRRNFGFARGYNCEVGQRN